jgi:hypothetical protein
MPNLDSSDLRDPQPPIPGERERALVAERADQLGRRRRLVQGGGALALVAAVAVCVAAFTAGGSSGPGSTNRIEAASGSVDTTAVAPTTTPATTVPATVATTVPAPVTAPAAQEAPAVVPDSAPAPQEAPAVVPSTFTLSGTVTGNPADTTVTLTIDGPGGQFTVGTDGAGNFSVSGLAAGDYQIVGQWVDTTGTATNAARLGTVTVSADTSVSLAFPG